MKRGKFKECGHVDHSTAGTPKGKDYSMKVAESEPSSPAKRGKISDGGNSTRHAKYEKA